MKTIKVIDLFIKLANGEEVPKKIKYEGVIYNYEFQNTITGAYEYRTQNYNCLMNNMAERLYLTDILKSEVEIIEEDKKIIEEDKEIRKLPPYKFEGEIQKLRLAKKIDELIDVVNELKKGE